MGRRAFAILACALASLAGLAGCSASTEQPILNQFFTASRLRDNTTLAGFSTVAFEPGTNGTITSFKITNVSQEQRKPLDLKSVVKAQEQARAEDEAYTRRRSQFADQYGEDVVSRVAKAGREAKLKGKDAEVHTRWFKLVDEGVVISKKVTDARRAVAAQSAVVDLSVKDPRNPIDVTKYDGELISKDVTIDAPVRLPTGQTAQKTLLVTMQRAILKGEKGEITGRWIITSIRDASGSASTPRG
jgi:hypothetical protein